MRRPQLVLINNTDYPVLKLYENLNWLLWRKGYTFGACLSVHNNLPACDAAWAFLAQRQ